MVGMQGKFEDALKDLVELEFDTIEAYETTLNRIEDKNYRGKLEEFKADHQRHTKEISDLLKKHNFDAPTGPSIGKQWLAKGKIVLANLIGDKTILSAMASNEEDTNTAYERINKRSDQWEDASEMLKKFFEDEKRHKLWFNSA
jgi:rubrerythrin